MGAVRKQYTKEFKGEAVRLITQGGVSLSQASRDLDINQNILRRWKQELERYGAKAFPGKACLWSQGVPVEQELARLQRETEVLRQEREVLKKAIFIFWQPQPGSTRSSSTTRASSRSSFCAGCWACAPVRSTPGSGVGPARINSAMRSWATRLSRCLLPVANGMEVHGFMPNSALRVLCAASGGSRV